MPHPSARQVDAAELTSTEGKVLGAILSGMGEDLHQLRTSVQTLTDGVGRVNLVAERQKDLATAVERCFAEVRRLDEASLTRREAMDVRLKGLETAFDARVKVIEQAMPAIIEMRTYVVRGVVCGIGLMALALVKMVIVDPLTAKPPVIQVVSPAPIRE